MSLSDKKRILITSARTFISLDIARSLHAEGHEVFVADTSKYHVCQFSNAIEKCYVVPSPRFAPKKYIEGLVKIVNDHKIDLVIPVYEEIMYLSRKLDAFPSFCHVLCSDFEILDKLHNKWDFYAKQISHGIKAPKTVLINNQKDLKNLNVTTPLILKATYSRASQSMFMVTAKSKTPTIKIEPYNPWIAQEWLVGKKYCTYSICDKGAIKAHATYPLTYSIEENSCLIFEAINHPKILKWVKDFIRLEKFSGQIGFDFIELEDGQLYAIECNPRATSGMHLLTYNKKVIEALFKKNAKPFYPKEGTAKQLACGMVLYGWKSSLSLKSFFKKLFSVQDVLYHKKDIKPFLSQPLLFFVYIARCLKLKTNMPSMFTHDIDWNGERVEELESNI